MSKITDNIVDLKQQKNEDLDATYQELEKLGLVKKEPVVIHDIHIEQLPQGWSKKIMNTILWGNTEGKSKYDN